MSRAALEKAVTVAEGQARLATKIGAILDRRVTQQHVWNWLNRDDKVPAEYCRAIEEATGGQVTASDLRPDLWPPGDPPSGGSRVHV